MESAAAARRYRETTLLDDDLMAQLREQRPPQLHLHSAALSRVEAISRQGGGRWPLFRESLRVNRWFLLGCGILLAIGITTGTNWAIYVGAGGLLAHIALFLRSSRHSDIYKNLLRASALGEWDRVGKLADRMQAVAEQQSAQIVFDLDVRRGVALAATQHLNEGVELVSRWESRGTQPSGMYWNRLASVYAKGGDYARFVEYMRRGFDESGGAIWARIDLALAIARVGDDPREALELLRHDSVATQPESTARFVHWARGVALLRLGDFQGAELALARAVDGYLAQAENPAVWTSLALSTGALAVAGSVNGKKDQARRLLAPLQPIFDAHADPALAALVKQRVLGED